MSARVISVAAIQSIVALEFGISIPELLGEGHGPTLAQPRQVAYFLARRHTGLSTPRLGRLFGGRDHTTILHGIRQVEARLAREPALAERVERLDALIITGEAVTLAPVGEHGPRVVGVPFGVSALLGLVGVYLRARRRLDQAVYTADEADARREAEAAFAALRDAHRLILIDDRRAA